MTISLPPEMAKQVEEVSRQESRTHSELVREALRRYFYSRFPVATASKAELKAITRSRAEVEQGHFVTLDQLLDDLASAHRKPRATRARKNPR
jgi:predicted transcriptional regulator